jgi:hypothetical protein
LRGQKHEWNFDTKFAMDYAPQLQREQYQSMAGGAGRDSDTGVSVVAGGGADCLRDSPDPRFLAEICDDDLLWRLSHEGRFHMKIQHWLGAVVLLAIGYFLGTKYPQLLAKITG